TPPRGKPRSLRSPAPDPVLSRGRAARSRSSASSVALAGNHEGLVEEPKPGVALQDLARRLEITAIAHHLREALVLDLRHVHRGVPGGEQRRRAYRLADLFRQRVHLVAEDRAIVGVGIEVEVPAVRAQLVSSGFQELVAIGLEGVLTGPDALHDLQSRVA